MTDEAQVSQEEDAVSTRTGMMEAATEAVREEAHKKIKSGEEQVCCDTCGVPCKDRESLKRHIRKKHPESLSLLVESQNQERRPYR